VNSYCKAADALIGERQGDEQAAETSRGLLVIQTVKQPDHGEEAK
jgi:hypothetical protein